MSSAATADGQTPIPLGPIHSHQASTTSNAPPEPTPSLVTPSTSSSSPSLLTNSSLPTGTRTRWTTVPKVWSFCNTVVTFFVAIATFVLAFVLFKPQALSTKLAVWTSQKDYLEYCQNHVNQPGGETDQDCQDALRRVLPPPPVSRLFKRLNATKLHLSRGPELERIRWRYWRPDPTCSECRLSPVLARPDPDVSSVGLQPLMAAELIFWLIISIVTWRVVLKARRTSSQGSRVNTPVGVDKKTKVDKNVQLMSGPYEAWVPDFVVRSFSSSIRKVRIAQETRLLWRPSTVEINDAQPESTLRRRHKKTHGSTPYVKEVPIEIPDDGDPNVSCDESDSELWIPVDRPQNTWLNDRHFEKLMPTMAALIGTYASILEVALNQAFTFYIDRVNSHNRKSRVDGSEHFITAPAYKLSLSDQSRDTRAKLAVSPLVTSIRRNIMNHGDVVYVSPQLRSSWQLTLTKSDNFNAIELTSSIVTRDYAGSSSFKSIVTEKMTPQMPTSSLILPFSSITFAVHEDQHLVSIFVDTDNEYEPAWTLLIRELEALFVKGPEETLKLFRYPKGELDGTKDAVPLNIWIYHQEDGTAIDPSPHFRKDKQPNETGDKSTTKSNETRPAPAEDRELRQRGAYRKKSLLSISQSASYESPFTLPSPALSLDADTQSTPEPNKSQKPRAKTPPDLLKSPYALKAVHPLNESKSNEASFALYSPSLSPEAVKQLQKTRLQRYALAHGKTLAEVTSEQFEDDEETPSPLLPRFTMEEKATNHFIGNNRRGDGRLTKWEDSLQSGLGTYQDNVPTAEDIGGLAKSSSLRYRLRKIITGRKPAYITDPPVPYDYGRRRRNAISPPGVPFPSRREF